MTPPEESELAQLRSITVTGAGDAKIPIQVQGVQNNHIESRDNQDIVIIISHEDPEISVGPDRQHTLSVDITNYGRKVRTISLAVEGVPKAVGGIDPITVTVSAGETKPARLVLAGTKTQPRAGTPSVRVRGSNVGDDDLVWLSNTWKISVAARPHLQVAQFVPPPTRVSGPGKYQASITLANDGNTRLAGSVDALDPTLVPNWPADSRRPAISPQQISGTGKFDLAPGETAPLRLDIVLPDRSLRDRLWQLMLVARVDRPDVAPVEHRSEIRQHGLVAEFASIATAWSWRPTELSRGVLVAVLATVLIAGVLGGVILRPSPTVAAVPHPLSQHRTAPTSAPRTPRETAAGGTNAAEPIPSAHMPCNPGSYIVFLGATSGSNAMGDAKYVMAYETSRSSHVPGERVLPYRVHATMYSDVCPAIKHSSYAEKAPSSSWFVWYGPVPTAVASTICTQIGKPEHWDCLAIPAT